MISVSYIVLMIIISILLILLSAFVPVATCTKRSISGKKVESSSQNVNKLKDKSALRHQKQSVEVTITHQNKKGDGYCKISTSKYDDRKFIVPGALIGETVTATIEKETKS